MAEIYDRDQVVENSLGKVRVQLFERGAQNLSGLGRAFKLADFNGNKKLDKEEFEEALSFASVFLKTHEMNAVFAAFDRSGDGQIDYDEFLRTLKGDLSPRRRAMVEKAFDVMDRDGSGVLTLEDLKGVYNGSKHPEVLAGRMTEDQALTAFLSNFEGKYGDKDGRVTKAEFMDYYSDVSASIPTDEYFITMMESVWMIPEGEYSAAEEMRLNELAKIIREKIRTRSGGGANPKLQLRNTFKFVDADETGAVTIDEFRNALERLGVSVQRRDVGYLFDMFDKDKSGAVAYEEFVNAVYAPERTRGEAF